MTEMNSSAQKPLISVVITCHAESILTHRTLKSVRRALEHIEPTCESEIILHADNPSTETLDYISTQKELALKDVRVFKNSFGDLGESRNYSIKMARGKYIATIDADDLMSQNWLSGALSLLEKQDAPTVAHSAVTVEFEGHDAFVVKEGEIDLATDTLLSVYANRWNSVIVAPRLLLLDNPYTANSPGYGYEDWHLNCRLIHLRVRNLLVPETAIFVRRKRSNSEWLRQIESMSVLRSNPLLSFESVRSIPNVFEEALSPLSPASMKEFLKPYILKVPLAHRIVRKVKSSIEGLRVQKTDATVPSWLKSEWKNLHEIDRGVFPDPRMLDNLTAYTTITPDHRVAGNLYKQLIDRLDHNHYDYLIFVPWLVTGGADQYAINYANTIADLRPNKKVLVLSTLPVESPWRNKLSERVSFVDFGLLAKTANEQIVQRVLEQLIENGGMTHLHVLNSELGYKFIELHKKYIKASEKKVVITSFSQSTDETERVFGYSHTHVPAVYDIADLITSDNNTVINMWQSDYGFNPDKLRVHRQPVLLPDSVNNHAPTLPLRILWAARVAPEKQPSLVKEIGQIVGSDATIDMYGTIEKGSEGSISQLTPNVSFKGAFNGFSSLPLNQYDILLYTSLFDGMPNTLLEAASVKLPIIASGVGGIPELIINKKTGLLIEDVSNPEAYASAIKSLVTDQFLMKKLADNAYDKIKTEFSPTLYIKSVETMLDDLNY